MQPSTTPDRPPDSEDESLLEVASTLDEGGWSGQFTAEPGAVLHCHTCDAVSPASAHTADEVTRLEGASDPSDMVIVIPLRCPRCGTRGTLIAGYGPEATAEEADVLLAMQRVPAEGADQLEPTPGVTSSAHSPVEAPAGRDAPRGA